MRARVCGVGAGWLVLVAGCAGPLDRAEVDQTLLGEDGRLRHIRPLDLPRDVTHLAPDEQLPVLPRAVVVDATAGTVPLTIEQARAAALENNLDIRVSLIAPAVAAERVSEEEAAFEAVFRVTGVAQQTDTPTFSELQDAQQEFQSLNPTLSIPTRLGGDFTISTPFNRNETNNPFATVDPAFTQDLEFSLSQPLLRGAGRRATTAGLRIASFDRSLAAARTKLEVIAQLAAVDRAYWQLYSARLEVAVRIQQRDLAIAQLERARRQFDAQRVVEVEVLRAESAVADRTEAIIIAQNVAALRERALKRLLNLPELPIQSDSRIDLASVPDPALYEADSAGLMSRALSSRMELLEVELQLAQDLVRIDLAENQALPTLNLDALYRINGLGGNHGGATEVLIENEFEDWRLALTAGIPIGNEAALSRLRQVVLGRLQRIATKELREQTIRQEVLDSVDDMETSWQRVIAARERLRLATRTLRAEERQFEVGRSTSTDVLDASARLADAQLSELSAIVDYQLAQVNLAVATGTLLGQAKVGLEFARRPELGGMRYWPQAEVEGEPQG
ncbi:MAG: TolC family protein [Phycisphaerales bacterium]